MEEANEKIRLRCEVIAELVMQMQPMYERETSTLYQRNHIETIIGAGLWYIPNKSLWTGRISYAAVSDFHPESRIEKPRVTEDHHYPRKVAARELLELDWTEEQNPPAKLTEMYRETFGRYNLVTPGENRALMPYQRTHTFESAELSYSKAGIELLNLDGEQLQRVKSRHTQAIERILRVSA